MLERWNDQVYTVHSASPAFATGSGAAGPPSPRLRAARGLYVFVRTSTHLVPAIGVPTLFDHVDDVNWCRFLLRVQSDDGWFAACNMRPRGAGNGVEGRPGRGAPGEHP